eukprot:1187845-Prorocentrum_minimum.AAC.13
MSDGQSVTPLCSLSVSHLAEGGAAGGMRLLLCGERLPHDPLVAVAPLRQVRAVHYVCPHRLRRPPLKRREPLCRRGEAVHLQTHNNKQHQKVQRAAERGTSNTKRFRERQREAQATPK